MKNQYKRRFVKSDDDDIISNLSEDLINPIFERLPVKDVVRTSVLSKKWRYRWTTMRTLAFDRQFSIRLSKNGTFGHNGFIRVINKIMIHHEGPIFKFHLLIPFGIHLDSFQEVDQWMLILSRNCVRELDIMNYYPMYQIPSSVFSCIELRVLQLKNCVFKPPLEFQGFPNLEVIFYNNVDFRSNLGGSVINLQQLKQLTLLNCKNVDYFNINAIRLRTLNVSIRSTTLSERLNLGMMLRKLPNLASLTINGDVLKFLVVGNVPKYLPQAISCLHQLELQMIGFDVLNQLQGALCMLRNSPNLKILRMTHVQMGPDADLELTTNYLESPDCLDQSLFMLQTIEMTYVEGTRPELLFIKLLLDHSPHLENIIIRPRAMADAQKMLNIAKDVMLFPRASTKAKMVYVVPEP